MKRLKKRVRKREAKRQQRIVKEIHSRSEFLPEYEKLYGSVWEHYNNGSFSIKNFRFRMKKIIKLKAFL